MIQGKSLISFDIIFDPRSLQIDDGWTIAQIKDPGGNIIGLEGRNEG